jgi:hypothetical protein
MGVKSAKRMEGILGRISRGLGIEFRRRNLESTRNKRRDGFKSGASQLAIFAQEIMIPHS